MVRIITETECMLSGAARRAPSRVGRRRGHHDLEALLEKYADQGIAPIEEMGVLKVHPLSTLGTPMEILQSFGGKEGYRQAVRELQAVLYGGSVA